MHIASACRYGSKSDHGNTEDGLAAEGYKQQPVRILRHKSYLVIDSGNISGHKAKQIFGREPPSGQ